MTDLTAMMAGDRDVVMSCRVRLARNVSGFPFVGRATHPQRREVLETVRAAAGPDEASVGLVGGGRVGATTAESLARGSTLPRCRSAIDNFCGNDT